MNVLLVYAHPEPLSYTGALKSVAVEELERQGHTVTVSDLYAMGFDPVGDGRDFAGPRLDEAVLNYAREQGNAVDTHSFAPDIAAEHAKLAAADLVIFQFPMWWFGFPAILKGWIDRVLAYKFAYGLGQWWDTGLMSGKRAMLAITTGSPASAYAPDGRNGDIERILWVIEAGVLAICGFTVLPSFIAYAAPWIGDAGRAKQIEAYRAHLAGLATATPREFHKLDEFGEDFRLKSGIEPRTAGQHRG